MAHSFVFKIKLANDHGNWPKLTRDETRRYGFQGQLKQQQVFTGLYDRTSSVFNLVPGQFVLEFANPPSANSNDKRILDTYDAFVTHCAEKVLNPHNLALQKLDEKGRIVLIFNVINTASNPSPSTETNATLSAGKTSEIQQPTKKDDAELEDKWQRETAEALARSSHEDHQQQSQPIVSEATQLGLRAFAQVERHQKQRNSSNPSTNFLDSSSADVNPPMIWNWASPPPPPTSTTLASLQRHQDTSSSSSSSTTASANSAPSEDPTSRDLSDQRRENQLSAFSKSTHSTAGPGNGYNPYYSVPAPYLHPSTSLDEHVPTQTAPVEQGSQSAQAETEHEHEHEHEPKEEETEAWSGVKTLLRNFVKDLNRHLADNFGDDAVGFELSLPPRSPADVESESKRDCGTGKAEAPTKHVHSSCFCDRCLKTIVGVRFKCQQCSNYDLCDSCIEEKNKFHADEHVFGEIEKPGDKVVLPSTVPTIADVEVPKPEAQTLHEHPAFCDLCDKSIRGTRHKCVNCPDFDVCDSCIAVVDDLHPHHNFVPIYDPSHVKIKPQPGDRAVHRNISCDGCGTQPILGVRYKCTHDECPNFDLCAACEAEPVARHPRSHNLLKIREPVRGTGMQARRSIIARARGLENEEESRYSATAQTEVSNTDLSSGFATLLQSIRTAVPAAFADPSSSSEGQACTAEFVQVGGDKTLVIDLDIDPSAHGLPSVMHVPIQVPKDGGLEEKIATSPVQAFDVEEKLAEEKVVVEEDEEKPAVVKQEDTPAPALGARFVSDVTLEDRSVVPAGSLFTKIWRVQNNGTLKWPQGTHLVNVGGFSRFAPSGGATLSRDVGLASPGEIVELQVDLQAPEDDGRHLDHWRLSTEEGERFGDRIWIDITVESDEERLRQSGSSLSSSIVAPSMNADGFNGAPPSTAASLTSGGLSVSSCAGDSDHVRESREVIAQSDDDEEDSDENSSENEEDSSDSSDDDDDDDFVVLSGTDPNDSETDSEWDA
ncbi:hypothetical protein T439DRAFT_320654 [Meredithblackwellia eburnea MCA 4105]